MAHIPTSLPPHKAAPACGRLPFMPWRPYGRTRGLDSTIATGMPASNATPDTSSGRASRPVVLGASSG